MLTRNIRLCDGWSFAKGSSDGPKEAYRPVRIPHDWGIENIAPEYVPQGESQGFFNERGIGWYRRTLTLRKKPGMRYYLNFDGVMENSTVWVNGHNVGGHGWGYTPFRLDITNAVKAGDNEIQLRADCSCTPPDRWYSGCGLYRPVTLITVPEIHLDERNVVVHTSVDGSDASITIHPHAGRTVKAMLALKEEVICTGEGDDEICLNVKNAQLWSAETPVLYTLTLSLPDDSDEISLPIGLRDVSIDLTGITVNGKPVYLRGVCLHQDIACVGIAATKELWRQRLLQLKEIGCNAIRGAHHVHSSDFMDLCDELGFYVYEEFTDKWHSGSYHRYFAADWKADVEGMLCRDRNRPSVIIWGCGNEVENQAQPSMLETLEMLTSYIRQADPTRPVTYAMNPHFKHYSGIDAAKVMDIQKLVDERDEYEIEDLDERIECISKIAQYVDIISCNYQEQWFDAIHRAIPDKPILGTEVYQFFIGHERAMQNYSTYDLPVAYGEKHPYCLGSFIWAGYDYLGESHGWPGKGSTGAVIRSNGRERTTAYILRALWQKDPLVHLSIMDYSWPDEITKEHWALPPYEDVWDFDGIRRQVFPFIVATNCDEVVIEYADRKMYLEPNSHGPAGYITGFIPYAPGTVRATGYIDGAAVCSHALHTPGKLAALRFTNAPDQLSNQCGYEVMCTLEAEDNRGIHVIRTSETVTFHVDGPAELIAVDNGDFCCPLAFHINHAPMFRGAISAVLRLTGETGVVTLRAETADGCTGTKIIQVVDK